MFYLLVHAYLIILNLLNLVIILS